MARMKEGGGRCVSQHCLPPHLGPFLDQWSLSCLSVPGREERDSPGKACGSLLSARPQEVAMLGGLCLWSWFAGSRSRGLRGEQSSSDSGVSCKPGHQESGSLTNLASPLRGDCGRAASSYWALVSPYVEWDHHPSPAAFPSELDMDGTELGSPSVVL